MRDIRSRVLERHGIELSHQQIQELAARRLEAILDPRAIKPSLMDELRRAAGIPLEPAPSEPEAGSSVDASSFYESSSGIVRFVRRLLNPLLKLFFNPQALIQAFSAQARLNEAAAIREAEHRRRQAEWNALHYEILRRLVTDIARAGIDTQSLALRVESLGAKVDFNERMVRGLEQTLLQSKPVARAPESPAAPPAGPATRDLPQERTPAEGSSEAGRRRRRRRRGRRPGGTHPLEVGGPAGNSSLNRHSESEASGADDVAFQASAADTDREPDTTAASTAFEESAGAAPPEPRFEAHVDQAAPPAEPGERSVPTDSAERPDPLPPE